MTHEELIAALEAAPVGTRELGVAVLEAAGAHADGWSGQWVIPSDTPDGDVIETMVRIGTEARVVTDLNFRLPGVPDGWWTIWNNVDWWKVEFMPGNVFTTYRAKAHTEALARCIVQLKAVLAAKGEK